ncbi:MAG: hypothetical protein ACRC2K_13260 [Clostridium sp.]
MDEKKIILDSFEQNVRKMLELMSETMKSKRRIDTLKDNLLKDLIVLEEFGFHEDVERKFKEILVEIVENSEPDDRDMLEVILSGIMGAMCKDGGLDA